MTINPMQTLQKEPAISDDVVVQTLKKKYFELAKIEIIKETPQITREVDNLEEAIRGLTKGSRLGTSKI